MKNKAPHFGYFKRKSVNNTLFKYSHMGATPKLNFFYFKHLENEKVKMDMGMTNSLGLEDGMITG